MGFYRSVARPLAFLLPPEASHRVAGLALRLPLPWRALGGVGAGSALDLAGLRVPGPVGLAAGYDKSATMLRGLTGLGFGYVVVGTVSRHPRAGNAKPRAARGPQPGSLVNAMGIPNDGAEAVAARIARRSWRTPVLASLADEEPDDVVETYRILAGIAAGFELNVSSPNSPWRHSGRDNAAHLREVLAALSEQRQAAHGPMFVKLPPFRGTTERETVLQLAAIAADGGASGFTCANTHPIQDARMSTGRGGLSGAPLSAHTPGMIRALREAFPELPINASGGIMGPDDAIACLDAGATTVQVYTALIYEGPRILRRLMDAAVAESRPRGQDSLP